MKKMKLKLSAISVILIFAMIFGSLVSCGEPSETSDTQPEVTTEPLETLKKTYSTANVEQDFESNKILVWIQPYANFYDYSVKDFSEINCISVRDMYTKDKIASGKQERWLSITLDKESKQNVIDCIKIIEQRDDVVLAQPNYLLTTDYSVADVHSNDPYYLSGDQWAAQKIKLLNAWNIETGSSDVLVGVIDSGIDGTHPDLSNRINASMSRCFTPDHTNPLEDATGHGTHVAGIIGAAGNNSTGITGTCWNIKIVSLRVAVGNTSNVYTEKIAEAIDYADSVGIKILNISSSSTDYNSKLETSISNYSGLIVCSAGNTGRNNDSIPRYPAAYPYDNIICVGNSTSTDTRSSSSCYGQYSVELFAPGTSILSCYPTSLCSSCTSDTSGHYTTGYHSLSGTSMAAPYVTGVAALILSHQSNLSAASIKQIILNNVDSVTGLSSYCVTGGRLNANAALRDSAIHRSHTMTLDTSYQDAEEHRYLCYSCGHADYDKHTWTLVQNGTNTADASINYVPIYKCTICDYTIYTSPSLQ